MIQVPARAAMSLHVDWRSRGGVSRHAGSFPCRAICGWVFEGPSGKDASASGDPNALRNGFVGRAAGFDVHESNLTPDPTTGTYAVIAGHPIATTYADQIVKTESLRLQDFFGDGIRGLHVFGRKVVRPEALALASVTVQA